MQLYHFPFLKYMFQTANSAVHSTEHIISSLQVLNWINNIIYNPSTVSYTTKSIAIWNLCI